MSWLDFFRSRKAIEEKIDKVALGQIQERLQAEKNKIKDKEKEVVTIINNRILKLTTELEEEKNALKKLDIKEKKVEEKIKTIVKGNVDTYSFYLTRLIDDLKGLEEENFGRLTSQIDTTFLSFKQKSSLSFQKATILVGKEFEVINRSIGSFFRDLKTVLEENQEMIGISKILNSAENESKGIDGARKSHADVVDNIKVTDNKIKTLESKSNEIKKQVERIKESEDYFRKIRHKKEIEKKKEDLDKEIYHLKEMIDLKSLAKHFHEDEKKRRRIEDYRANFKESFFGDNGKGIIDLFEQAKGRNEEIIEKIREIDLKREEIEKTKIEPDEAKELENETGKIKLEIESLRIEMTKEMKKQGKIEETIRTAIDSLKEELHKIKIELTD